MWIIIILLCISVVVLIQYSRYLQAQVRYYEAEEQKQEMTIQATLNSKKMLMLWIKQKDQGKEVIDYLKKHNMNRVAIYGMTEVGERLYQELKDQVTIVCCIDRSKTPFGRKTVRPNDFREDVDVIIVTVASYFSEIYDLLNKKTGGKIPIVGLDEIIYELNEENSFIEALNSKSEVRGRKVF